VHLHGTLTVTNIVDFLFGNAIHVCEYSREVIICHVLEGKFPKLLIFVRVVFGMISRVLVAPAVSKPNVITSIC
jgi:hypothetical protein